MSKIGKKNIVIPKDSSIKIEGGDLTISGPKGTKKLTINDKIFSSKLVDSQFQILPLEKKVDKKISIMWGTYRSLINNAIMGVSSGHEKILELNGDKVYFDRGGYKFHGRVKTFAETLRKNGLKF